eukprot:COSAG03_NODE_2160_length_3063_cov_1.525978_2_plen_75_part_00
MTTNATVSALYHPIATLATSCVRSIGSRLCRQEACAGAARAVEELGEYERSAVESIEAALGVLTSSEERTDANL